MLNSQPVNSRRSPEAGHAARISRTMMIAWACLISELERSDNKNDNAATNGGVVFRSVNPRY
jgi:hypothetical protein